ncbi:hypothetical protein HBB16_16985 [Pseudonocardia sp. MCCB 268]|nr:hypothetical protein [Pseudonocardia cytotoxica]
MKFLGQKMYEVSSSDRAADEPDRAPGRQHPARPAVQPQQGAPASPPRTPGRAQRADRGDQERDPR